MSTYITKSGDSWDQIARDTLGSERRADLLMTANRPLLGTFLFSAGTVLEIPSVERRESGLLPPWKGGANG